ncbi:hypothetical protein SAMN05444390_103226 [Marinobacterium lutimaris]|uniref:Uncharacterized protein n=1 Tax=Marinobacterium lutimaris TaxID=568106 RepID=A0A1H6C689_9GAMM|nr:hypothetical protein SAMN05444390_103226 [Marinobacterium lutimaris]
MHKSPSKLDFELFYSSLILKIPVIVLGIEKQKSLTNETLNSKMT